MTNAIETDGLTRHFGRTRAVDRLTLQIPAGRTFALIGPNGAGKTTTLQLVLNLLRPQHGVARLLGCDSRRLGSAQFQRVGYVSEDQQLPDWMTFSQLLDFCRPLYPDWDEGLAAQLARSLNLTSGVPLRTLSRGTRMKARLVATLAYRPDVILLDEPFTALDPLVRDELVRCLLEVAAETPRTVVIASHDIDEVERVADWVGFMVEGRLLFAEPVAALLARFRLVEVGGTGAHRPPLHPLWIPQTPTASALRFVDPTHGQPEAAARIAAAFPAADVRTTTMSLRDIVVALAGRASVDRTQE